MHICIYLKSCNVSLAENSVRNIAILKAISRKNNMYLWTKQPV